jgi:protein SCO1
MSATRKKLLTVMWTLAGAAIVSLATAAMWASRSSSQSMPVLFDVPPFSLTNQNGQTVTDADLRGNVWIGMVFFTTCPDVCPMMLGRMTQLQKTVTRPDVKIVSFSIDPAHDTPAAMKEYAQRLGADQSRWHMLTGEQEAMYGVARGLKLAAVPASDGKPITHTGKVLLIDRENHVRGIYDSSGAESMKKLARDAETLAAQ